MKYLGAFAIVLTLALCYAAPQQTGHTSGSQAGASGQGLGFGVTAGASGQLDQANSASGLVKRDLSSHAHAVHHTSHTSSCHGQGPPPPSNFTG